MDDLVAVDWPHEADLAVKLGYALWCYVAGNPQKLKVVKTRRVGEGFEVLIAGYGWYTPERCWAVLKSKPIVVEQGNLFG